MVDKSAEKDAELRCRERTNGGDAAAASRASTLDISDRLRSFLNAESGKKLSARPSISPTEPCSAPLQPLSSPSAGHSVRQPGSFLLSVRITTKCPHAFSPEHKRFVSGGRIVIMVPSGAGRCRWRPGGVLRYLVSACLLSVLLYLPEARASYYPQSGECKGKGKECTGKTCCRCACECVKQSV